MRLFKCAVCAQLLHFENTRCERCGHVLGYDPGQNQLLALQSAGEHWRSVAAGEADYRFCANADHAACNWLIADSSPERFCLACRHNGIIPDLSQSSNLASWRKIEVAKHRLFYTLLRLRLPLATRAQDPQGLQFNFLAEAPAAMQAQVMTGHDSGVITLAVAEAEDAERERRRAQMGEPYRTLLGHLRHEVGHYFWARLVREGDGLDPFRAMFGDERRNYQEALQIHYRNGAPADWQSGFVSAYATSHPFEDFAETWAHYLHIIDTMEMARAFHLQVDPPLDDSGILQARIHFDPYRIARFDTIVDGWVPIAFAMNSINRCMGQPDLYPFVLSPAAIGKLGFIHELLRGAAPPAAAVTSTSAADTAQTAG